MYPARRGPDQSGPAPCDRGAGCGVLIRVLPLLIGAIAIYFALGKYFSIGTTGRSTGDLAR